MSGMSETTRQCMDAAARIANSDHQFSTHDMPDHLKKGIAGIVKAGFVIHINRAEKTFFLTAQGRRYIKLQGLGNNEV